MNAARLSMGLFLLLLVLNIAPTSGQDRTERDYATELPRIPPKEPADALKSFRLRPGFQIELVAAEPLVQSPVALDFDEDGRMYVVEYPEYNQYANPGYKGTGRVKLLEDVDGDGRYEKSTVFLDKLPSPTAVACWDGGVFVGAVPDILYCKDTDGDGKADLRTPVFTGFGRDAAGEAMLNSFRWGLDNRIHLSTSLGGGDVRPAGKPEARSVSVRNHGFAFDPRSLSFELTGGGGQHGLTLDDWGRKLVCANSDPIHLVMYDSRYLLRNPFLQAPPAAVNIAPAGKYTKLFRVSANEPWRVLRTRLRSQGAVPGSDEGGQPSGFFTGATGITVYRGDAWPAEYRGDVFIGEVSGNLIHRARLEPNGVGFSARRADADVEFLASTDNWFRPVQLANAPDGSLFVIDMYRGLIEGAAFLPPVILKHIDVGAGLDRGRIYRVVADGQRRSSPPRLGRAATHELVALLEHRNGWHRDTASRLLYQRQNDAAVPLLRKLVRETVLPEARVHALYALASLNGLASADVLHSLGDPDARVREHALRLAESFATDVSIRSKLEQLVGDGDARVRYQLAFSLGAFRGEFASRALTQLALRDGSDSWMRVAVLSSLSECSGEVFAALLADRGFRTSAHGRTFLTTLAVQVGAAGRTPDVAAVVKAIDSLPGEEKALTQDLVRGLASKQSASARDQLAAGKAGTILGTLLAEARTIAASAKAKPTDRAAAVRTLALAEFADVRSLLAELLQLQQPQPVQAATLEMLGRFDRPEAATLILSAWPGLSPQLRATAAETLFSRPAWIAAFLDAIEQGRVGRGDVDPARVQLLQVYPDEKLRTRAAKVFAVTRLSPRADVVAAYQKALTLPGDVGRGRTIFRKECAACHQLERFGNSIGADLSAIRDRGAEAVLLNILDPNREVKPQFVSYVLVTNQGRVLTGMILEETATSVTIRRADGTSETVLRSNVEELRSSSLSFMPEGLEKQIDVPAMADLLAYLNSIR